MKQRAVSHLRALRAKCVTRVAGAMAPVRDACGTDGVAVYAAN
jgi:hypothetical protein